MASRFDQSDEFDPLAEAGFDGVEEVKATDMTQRILRVLYMNVMSTRTDVKDLKRRLFEGYPGAAPELVTLRDAIAGKANKADVEALRVQFEALHDVVQKREIANAKIMGALVVVWGIVQVSVQFFSNHKP